MGDEIKKLGAKGMFPVQPGAQAQVDPGVQSLLDRVNSPSIEDTAPPASVDTIQDDDGLSDVAEQVRSLNNRAPAKWGRSMIRNLLAVVKKVIDQKLATVAASDRIDDYAVQTAANAIRFQLRKLIQTLTPTDEIAESDEFQELLDLLLPPSLRRKGGQFEKGSAFRGSVKSGVKQQLVQDAVREASKRAGKKMLQQQTDLGQGTNQFSSLSLEHMARFIKRKLKKRKKGAVVDEDGQPVSDAQESDALGDDFSIELRELMEIFSQKALETMRVIREEICPTWAPDQQPWLIQEADRQVFDILLASIPVQLFEQTQAWGDIQDLRKGHAVFTLRAADKLTEAARRHKT